MPAVMKPVAPQATHGLPTSSLPEPPHFSQGFSPVPGVPAGASSPGFIFGVATMTACWFFDLLGFICNSLRLSNYHSNRHRRPRGPENRGHISPDHLARLIMCPLCIADDDRHEATAVAIRARSGVESAGASAAGAQALSALWRAWRCFVADASLWQYGGRVGKLFVGIGQAPSEWIFCTEYVWIARFSRHCFSQSPVLRWGRDVAVARTYGTAQETALPIPVLQHLPMGWQPLADLVSA